MRIRLDLDPVTTEQLIESANNEFRPIPLQAEVILRKALGTYKASNQKNISGKLKSGSRSGEVKNHELQVA